MLLLPSALPAAKGVFRDYLLPSAGAEPTSIVRSFNGEIWFTEFAANKIGRISQTGQLTEYMIPTPASGPLGITVSGFDVWFTEFNANKIGRITREGVISEFPIPTPAGGPYGITGEITDAGVWFTELNGNKLGRIAPDGLITEFSIPTPDSGLMGISRGPWGTDIWFTESRANKIGWMFSNGGTVTEIPVPSPDSAPTDITMDNLGRIWFTEYNGNRIGKIEHPVAAPVIEELPVPTPDSGPFGIDVRQDGTVFFTERRAKKVGMVDRSGLLTEFAIRGAASEPTGMAVDLWYVWFTDRASGSVVRMIRDAVALVGTGVSGTWDTEFLFANPGGSSQDVYVGAFFEPSSVCPGYCLGQSGLSLAGNGAGNLKASGTLLFGGVRTVYARGSQAENPPTVTARVFNTEQPSQSIEVPSIRLSTLTERNPSMLAFPSAARGQNIHSNLVLAEVGYDDDITVQLDAFSSAGHLLGSNSFRIEVGTTLFLVDVLAQLGVAEVDGGQIRVTRTGGTGLMWGVLATLSDDGGVTVSPGLNP